MATTTITGLPAKTPAGSQYMPVEDSTSTGKATINDIVAASAKAQEHDDAISELNSNLSKVLQSTELSSGDDLNNVKTPGFYYIRSGVANCPEDWTWMIVIGGLGIRQVLFRTNLISTRAYTGSPLAWTIWKSVTLS